MWQQAKIHHELKAVTNLGNFMTESGNKGTGLGAFTGNAMSSTVGGQLSTQDSAVPFSNTASGDPTETNAAIF